MAIDMRVLTHGTVDPKTADADTLTTGSSEGSTATVGTGSDAKVNALKDASETSSVDGSTRVSSKSTESLNPAYISSAPDLPDPVGPRAPLAKAAALISTTTALQTSPSHPISAAEAFDLLQRAAQQGYELSSIFNRIANRANIDAKTSEAKHLMDQVAGEREHANTALAGAVAGAGLGAYVGIHGATLARSDAGKVASKSNDASTAQTASTRVNPLSRPFDSQTRPTTPSPDPASGASNSVPTPSSAVQNPAPEPVRARASSTRPAADHPAVPATPPHNQTTAASGAQEPEQGLQSRDVGGGISQMGQPVSNVVTTAFDTYDKTAANGGQYQADQAKIAQKNDTVAGAIAQTTLDSSKSSLDKAQEDIKAAQQAIQSYAERQAQVMNNIANR